MYGFVSHQSACEALRRHIRDLPRWPENPRVLPIWGDCVSSQKKFRKWSSEIDLAAYGLTSPVDLIVPSESFRSRGKGAKFHVWKHSLPQRSMIRANKTLLISGPEFVLIQLAGYQLKLTPIIDDYAKSLHADQDVLDAAGVDEYVLHDDPIALERIRKQVDLICTAMEFMGTYRISSGDQRTQYLQPTLTTIESIHTFMAETPRALGCKRLKAALDMAFERSASPMETTLALMLTLPTEYGGFGLPKPELNVQKDVHDSGLVPPERKAITPDLLWEEEHVALEYDSDEFHGLNDTAQLARDAFRSNVLTALGYRTLRATTNMVRKLYSLELLAKHLAVVLGQDLQDPNPLLRQRRRRLHAYLLNKR